MRYFLYGLVGVVGFVLIGAVYVNTGEVSITASQPEFQSVSINGRKAPEGTGKMKGQSLKGYSKAVYGIEDIIKNESKTVFNPFVILWEFAKIRMGYGRYSNNYDLDLSIKSRSGEEGSIGHYVNVFINGNTAVVDNWKTKGAKVLRLDISPEEISSRISGHLRTPFEHRIRKASEKDPQDYKRVKLQDESISVAVPEEWTRESSFMVSSPGGTGSYVENCNTDLRELPTSVDDKGIEQLAKIAEKGMKQVFTNFERLEGSAVEMPDGEAYRFTAEGVRNGVPHQTMIQVQKTTTDYLQVACLSSQDRFSKKKEIFQEILNSVLIKE